MLMFPPTGDNTTHTVPGEGSSSNAVRTSRLTPVTSGPVGLSRLGGGGGGVTGGGGGGVTGLGGGSGSLEVTTGHGVLGANPGSVVIRMPPPQTPRLVDDSAGMRRAAATTMVVLGGVLADASRMQLHGSSGGDSPTTTMGGGGQSTISLGLVNGTAPVVGSNTGPLRC